MKLLWLLAAVVAVVIVCYIRMFNRLRRLSIKVEEGSAGIDVALEKRYDLLSEELEAVKKYLQHEQEVYLGVTTLRAGKELNEAAFQEKKALSEEAVETIRKTIDEQQKTMLELKSQLKQTDVTGEGNLPLGDGGLVGHQVSLDRKLGLLASVQQGLTGVTSSINALVEQYPFLHSSGSMAHFQRDIFDVEEHLQAARRLYNSNVSLYNQRVAAFPYLIVAKLHRMKEARFYTVEEKKKNFEVRF